MPLTEADVLKGRLREQMTARRREIPPGDRARNDRLIAQYVRLLPEYRAHGILLCYVSTGTEPDTVQVIENAWRDGKTVAVPRCIPETRELRFFGIQSFAELHLGLYGIREPFAVGERLIEDVSNCFCLVPALSADREGYRLGYGKGYYDRFLSGAACDAAALCYGVCLVNRLPRDRHDAALRILVSEKGIYRVGDSEQESPARRKQTDDE